MQNFEDSYNIFKIKMDGDEFDSDDEALVMGNVAFREVLNERDWKFLKKTYTLPINSLDLSPITDLDKVLTVWLNGNKLKKADFHQRFDPSFDYWIDHANNKIVPTSFTLNNQSLIVDYKYRPDDLEADTPIIKADFICSLIADRMRLNYMDKDQDTENYSHAQADYESNLNKLIAYNESL